MYPMLEKSFLLIRSLLTNRNHSSDASDQDYCALRLLRGDFGMMSTMVQARHLVSIAAFISYMFQVLTPQKPGKHLFIYF